MLVFNLEGRRAIVTGASRGIGEATARALDHAGARVALVARSKEALDAVASELIHDPLVIVADLSSNDAPRQVADAALSAFETVDILVNNAATAVRLPSLDLDGETIDGMLQVNVRNLLLLSTAVISSMVRAGGGCIVNLASISGVLGTPHRAAYAASKSAVEGLTKSLAQEFGPHGIRVNAVAPGVIDTRLWAKNKAIPGVEEAVNRHIPLGRWGTSEEVASVITFLASDAARYVSAQTIGVDGGMANTLDLYHGPI